MTNESEQKCPDMPLKDGSACQATPDTDSSRADVATHLANERTFLAWSFTALLIIGSGVVLARTLIALNTSPLMAATGNNQPFYLKPTTIGLLFMVGGLAVELLAACRYLTVHRQIIEHRYRPSSLLVMLFLAIVLALCVVLTWLLMQLRGML